MAEKDIILEEKTTEETKEEVKEETPLEDVVLETEGGAKSLLGATSGTDIAATSLDTKTTPAGTDNLILFNQNTNVGYQIDYDNLADAILNKITSKTYANQVGGSSAATLLAQLSTLNSNTSLTVLTHKNTSSGTFTYELGYPCVVKVFYSPNGNNQSVAEYTVVMYSTSVSNVLELSRNRFCTVTMSEQTLTVTTTSGGSLFVYRFDHQ